jgi:hypothetical protein
VCFPSHQQKVLGRFHSVARSGQESIAQGVPWAKLSCPFGAGPSGRMTGAKHIVPSLSATGHQLGPETAEGSTQFRAAFNRLGKRHQGMPKSKKGRSQGVWQRSQGPFRSHPILLVPQIELELVLVLGFPSDGVAEAGADPIARRKTLPVLRGRSLPPDRSAPSLNNRLNRMECTI